VRSVEKIFTPNGPWLTFQASPSSPSACGCRTSCPGGAAGLRDFEARVEAAGIDRVFTGDHVTFRGGHGFDGDLVATSLDNPVTPMVRFRSDDIIRMTRQPCGCGRTHARFWPVGRKGDETIVAGRSFVPMDISRALEHVPETATALFQLVRPAREIDELKVRVGYDPDITTSLNDLRDRVSEAIEAAVGVPPVLELLPEPELLACGRGGKLPGWSNRDADVHDRGGRGAPPAAAVGHRPV
jgi:hypothetical protein